MMYNRITGDVKSIKIVQAYIIIYDGMITWRLIDRDRF